jgi:hypothetical protein
MRTFRLLAGGHNENGRNYKQGDVVESEGDLVKRFGTNKFVEVGEPIKQTPLPKKKKPKKQEPEEEEPVKDEEEEVVKDETTEESQEDDEEEDEKPKPKRKLVKRKKAT